MGKYIIAFSVIVAITAFTSTDIKKESYDFSLKVSQINGTVTGTVTIPDQSSTRRRFRGSSYRNRGNAGSVSDSDNSSNESGTKFSNTIVSAHPLSYSITNDISGDPIKIEQKDATFLPNVTPATVGTVVQFVNNDPFFHNVFSLTPGSKFDIGRRPTGYVYSKQIEAPKWKVTGIGPITLFCDIHSQMKATILSLDTPYFTRLKEDGSYELSGLPEGEYEIRVFNSSFDIISKTITVLNNSTEQTDFNLSD
jgi:plastocyanin